MNCIDIFWFLNALSCCSMFFGDGIFVWNIPCKSMCRYTWLLLSDLFSLRLRLWQNYFYVQGTLIIPSPSSKSIFFLMLLSVLESFETLVLVKYVIFSHFGGGFLCAILPPEWHKCFLKAWDVFPHCEVFLQQLNSKYFLKQAGPKSQSAA